MWKRRYPDGGIRNSLGAVDFSEQPDPGGAFWLYRQNGFWADFAKGGIGGEQKKYRQPWNENA